MESYPELSGERGITLVSPEDKLDISPRGDQFKSKSRMVPDLGMTRILGTKVFQHADDALGVTIIEKQTVIKRVGELFNMGVFEIGVEVDALSDTTTCNMMVCGISIESNMEIMEDEEIAEGISSRYWGFADRWKLKGDGRKLYFFAPPDPEFLSQLQFSFHAELPPTQSSAQVKH